MNRFILCIFVISLPLQMLGQLFPQSNHYEYNALDINPAFAGCRDALSATISYRNQWVGFKGSPKSAMLSVHTPVLNDRIGLGLLIEKNSIGIFKETSIFGNYAYRMELRDGKLALGLGFGVTIYNVAWNELDVSDTGDEQLMNNGTSAVLPDFSLGTYYYTKKYFIGISIPMFLSHDLNQTTGSYKIENKFSEYNYFLTGGYEVDISPQVKLIPSLLIKYHPNNDIQIDYNALVNLRDNISVGIGYRNKDILIVMLQCQLNYQIRMIYSYDYNLGSVGRYINASHEIVFNYIFRYARK